MEEELKPSLAIACETKRKRIKIAKRTTNGREAAMTEEESCEILKYELKKRVWVGYL